MILGKENLPINICRNNLEIRSPLKNIDFNTFNFVFSTQKKNQSNKKYSLSVSNKNSNNKIKIDDKLKLEFTNNDIIDIFKEYMKNRNLDTSKPSALLSKKRKRNFKTISSENRRKKYIIYKNKKKLTTNQNESEPKKNFSVMTYNILNPSCMKKENEEELSTDERMKKIKKEILSLSPDVFCLQEADIYIYNQYLMKNDMSKYEILYGINCGSSFINIIGYKKEKYILIFCM